MSDDLPSLARLPDGFAQLLQGLQCKGRWAPLFVEPISGSGELITTSIAAVGRLPTDPEDQVLVERVIRPEVLRALYGSKARVFSEMIAAVEHSVGKALRLGAQEPHLPLSGFLLGRFRRASGSDLPNLIEQGRQRCASLSKTRLGEAVEPPEDDSQRTEAWIARIRSIVLTTAADLKPCFDVPTHSDHGRTRIDFYNGRYAAQFGVIRRENPGASVYHLKPKLWELVSLRPDLAGNVRERELILHRPKLGTVTMSLNARDRVRDVVDELTQVADRSRIRIYDTDRAVLAANRVTSQARRLAA